MRSPPVDVDTDIRILSDRFDWAAFLFGGAWALWRGMWAPGAALLVAVPGLAAAAEAVLPQGGVILYLGLSVLIGLRASDLRAWRLLRGGYSERGVVEASDPASALRKFCLIDAAAARDLVRAVSVQGRRA